MSVSCKARHSCPSASHIHSSGVTSATRKLSSGLPGTMAGLPLSSPDQEAKSVITNRPWPLRVDDKLQLPERTISFCENYFACSSRSSHSMEAKKTKIVKSPKQLRLTENKFMKCTRVRGKTPLCISILFGKTPCKGKLMISLNFLREPGRSDELIVQEKTTSLIPDADAPKPPIFWRGFQNSSAPTKVSAAPERMTGRPELHLISCFG